jgi:hypothetical protein
VQRLSLAEPAPKTKTPPHLFPAADATSQYHWVRAIKPHAVYPPPVFRLGGFLIWLLSMRPGQTSVTSNGLMRGFSSHCKIGSIAAASRIGF